MYINQESISRASEGVTWFYNNRGEVEVKIK